MNALLYLTHYETNLQSSYKIAKKSSLTKKIVETHAQGNNYKVGPGMDCTAHVLVVWKRKVKNRCEEIFKGKSNFFCLL